MTDKTKTIIKLPRRRGRPAKAAGQVSDQILPAALIHFAQAGFEATNLRQIATAAGIDVALISHRYGSKVALWRAVVDFLAEQFLNELSSRRQEAVVYGKTGRQSLQCSLEQLVDLVCDQPAVALFLVRETGQQGDRFEYFHERLVRPVHDMIMPLAGQETEKSADAAYGEDVLFFTFTGAIAITVAMRPFIDRFSQATRSDETFRRAFKSALFGNFLSNDDKS